MKRIIVSVTNDLTSDQRVHKTCTHLRDLGFEILLVGRKQPQSRSLNRKYRTKRMRLLFTKGFLFYAEYNLRLFLMLIFSEKNVLLANDLDTLLPNFLISKLFRIPLVYDSHELFTEVPELISRPKVQKVWLGIECFILPKLKNCYTVCNSIGNYYNNKYNTSFRVVRNFPYLVETRLTSEFPFATKDKKIILYQGALNKGRGLELIINTMPFLEEVLLVIIGNGDIKNEIKKLVNLKHLQEKVKILEKLTPIELKKITPLADLGLSVEEDLCLNYRYALPNKLFDYIQANIPVLVSDLVEMKKIILKYQVGEIISNRNPKYLARQIKSILLKDKKTYNKFLTKASRELTWQNESKVLTSIFKEFV